MKIANSSFEESVVFSEEVNAYAAECIDFLNKNNINVLGDKKDFIKMDNVIKKLQDNNKKGLSISDFNNQFSDIEIALLIVSASMDFTLCDDNKKRMRFFELISGLYCLIFLRLNCEDPNGFIQDSKIIKLMRIVN